VWSSGAKGKRSGSGMEADLHRRSEAQFPQRALAAKALDGCSGSMLVDPVDDTKIY